MIQDDIESARAHLNEGNWAEAEAAAQRALAQDPNLAPAMLFAGIAVFQSGRPEEGIKWMQRAAATDPSESDYLYNLGIAFNGLNQWSEAAAALRQAVALRADFPLAWQTLGLTLRISGDATGAIEAFRNAVKYKPDFLQAQNDLGVTLATSRRLVEAVETFRAAVELAPDRADVLNNLANALVELRRWDEAIPLLHRALKLNPDLPQAYANLGNALRGKNRPEEAIASLKKAIQLDPQSVDPATNLIVCLRDIGRLEEAAAVERHVLEVDPTNSLTNTNRLFHLYFDATKDEASIYREHARWNERFAAPLTAATAEPHTNDRSENRRLRVGYVSPDFRRHCQAYFTYPLLSNHSRESFEIFCYASIIDPDQNTEQLRKFADVWRDCVGKSDAEVAEMIRDDRIDVLVDLTMHMMNGRPLLFARRPAPVQVAWLAYPGTTGLEAIDYRLTDPYLDPPGAGDANYCEKSFRLPNTFWCYHPLRLEPPVNDLPALKNGLVTFGCLNASRKITDRTLDLWAKVLASVAGSRLVMLYPPGEARQRVLGRLGVPAERVEFVPFQDPLNYRQTYHRIDLGLDTLPYNGHTTSLDSYWMGVPVVTRVGETVVGRAGWSQLNNLQLTELVARTDEDFVKIAAGLAGDLPRLANLRATLRGRMAKSPLMDAPRFARDMESAYRQMWTAWCRSNPAAG
jgi:protein O-GlcNAc transferase